MLMISVFKEMPHSPYDVTITPTICVEYYDAPLLVHIYGLLLTFMCGSFPSLDDLYPGTTQVWKSVNFF